MNGDEISSLLHLLRLLLPTLPNAVCSIDSHQDSDSEDEMDTDQQVPYLLI